MNLYLIIFYVLCVLSLITICCIIYIYYFPPRFFITTAWFIRFLSVWVILLCTVLYLPSMGTILIIFECKGAPSVSCFEGIYLLHFVFGFIVFSLNIFFSSSFSLIYHEIKLKPKNNMSLITGKFNCLIVIYKTGLLIIECVLRDSNIYWIEWFYMLVFTGYMFFAYGLSRIYFSVIAQSLCTCFTLLNFWMALAFAFSNIFGVYYMRDNLEFYFAGTILLIAGIILQRNKDWEDCLCTNRSIKTKEDILKKILTFADIVVNNIDGSETNMAVIKGYIMKHSRRCLKSECVLKNYVKTYYNFFHESNKDLKINTDMVKEGQKVLLMHYNEVFLEGIEKFPTDKTSRLIYCYYLINVANNRGAALEHLSMVESQNPSFEEQALIYCYRLDIKESLLAEKSNNDQISVSSLMAYESHLKLLEDKIEASATLHYQFWELLIEPGPDLIALRKYGFDIQSLNKEIEDHWKEMQRINPDMPNSLKLYGTYLAEVVNDEEYNNELREKLRNIDIVKARALNYKSHAANTSDVNAIAQYGDSCICTSGKSEILGKISNCNLAFCRMFGYTLQEMNGMYLGDIMPEIFARYHQEALTKALEKKGNWENAKKELNIFGKTKNGYIISLLINLVSLPTLFNEDNFVAILRLDKSSSNYNAINLLLDKNKIITEMTSSGEPFLGTLKEVKQGNIYFRRLCPELDIGEKMPKKFEVKTRLYALSNNSIIEINCTIEMLEMLGNEIGYSVKLVLIGETYPPPKEISPNPFEFLYNENTNKYVRVFGEKEKKKALIKGRLSIIDETHMQATKYDEEIKENNHIRTPRDLIRDFSSKIEPFKTPFFKTAKVGLQNILTLLESRNEYNLIFNKELMHLLEKDFAAYASSITTYRILGDETIEVNENNNELNLFNEDSDDLSNKNNRTKQIIDKKNEMLMSMNVKGKRSLERILIQGKKTYLLFIYLASYLLFGILFALAIMNFIYIVEFFTEIDNKLYLVGLSYRRIVVTESITYRVQQIFYVSL